MSEYTTKRDNETYYDSYKNIVILLKTNNGEIIIFLDGKNFLTNIEGMNSIS